MSMEVGSRDDPERVLERLVSWNLPDTEQGTTQRLHASHICEGSLGPALEQQHWQAA